MPHYHLPHNHGQDIEKVLDKMPAEENFREIAFLFQQLSDPSRLRLLWLLCHSEECVCNLAAAVDMSAPAITHYPIQLPQNFSIKRWMPYLKYPVRPTNRRNAPLPIIGSNGAFLYLCFCINAPGEEISLPA